MVPEQCVDGHHHPRGAEATLGAVALGDPLLHGVEPGLDASHTFHGGDSSPMQGAQGHQACHDGEVSCLLAHRIVL